MAKNATLVEIEKASPIPIYHQIKEGFVELINAGNLKPGDPLPSENQLSQHLQISPMTVRQAMKSLVDEGYILRERGRGTFVSQRRLRQQLGDLHGFTERMNSQHIKAEAKILRFEQVGVPRPVVELTHQHEWAMFTRIQRLRLADEQPIGIHDSYINGVDISYAELEQIGSLYHVLVNKGIVLDRGQEMLEATAATEEVARLLNVEIGFPLLKATRFSWDIHGHFVEYIVAFYHADLYQYVIQLKR